MQPTVRAASRNPFSPGDAWKESGHFARTSAGSLIGDAATATPGDSRAKAHLLAEHGDTLVLTDAVERPRRCRNVGRAGQVRRPPVKRTANELVLNQSREGAK